MSPAKYRLFSYYIGAKYRLFSYYIGHARACALVIKLKIHHKLRTQTPSICELLSDRHCTYNMKDIAK